MEMYTARKQGMKNLFEATTVEEVKGRIAQLKPDSERVWGKMNPAQALAHCSAAMEMAMGTRKPPPRIFIGRLLGRFAKKSMIAHEKPMPRRSCFAFNFLFGWQQN
jgi:hypothetical protein